jgi:hypothetical protein
MGDLRSPAGIFRHCAATTAEALPKDQAREPRTSVHGRSMARSRRISAVCKIFIPLKPIGPYTQASMLDLSLRGTAVLTERHTATAAVREVPRIAARQPRLVLRSRTPERERWYVDLLEDNPRLAAAVELVLRSEEGIEEVRANPLTGRVLVRYRPDAIPESVETLLCRAVQAGPMSREEFAALRPKQPGSSASKRLLTAEIVCSLSHLVIFGGLCPLGLAATGVLLLLHRQSGTHTHG